MKIGVLDERGPAEARVALVPETVRKLVTAGHAVAIESGAGAAAWLADEAYAEAGATVGERSGVLDGVDLVVRIGRSSEADAAALPEGVALVGFLQPATEAAVVGAFAARKIDVFSLDLLPRISRAQSMDALSSQATVAGYLAVLLAATRLPRFFPLLMTAAGTVPPARVLVLGAGVAGLQAIATARRLGAVVSANDVRSAAREEVESLGATFVELGMQTQEGAGGYAREQSEEFLALQRDFIGQHVAASDVVITTAAVPGRPAPRIVSAEMVAAMGPGSVLVDLAADGGGNSEVTVPGETVLHHGVQVVGVRNPPSGLPTAASVLYSRNVAALLPLLARDGRLDPDPDDEIVAGVRVTHGGQVVHPAARQAVR